MKLFAPAALRLRPLFALFAWAAALLAGAVVGCGDGAIPSGSQSAANGVVAGAAGFPHLVGFRVDECVPGLTALFPPAGNMWFFVTTNKATMTGPAMSNVQVLVNGQVQTGSQARVRAIGTGNRAFWIIFTNPLQQGALVQVDASVSGQQLLSNTITVPAPGLPTGNTPSNNAFVLGASPPHNQVAPRPIVVDFTHNVPPGTASTYLIVVLDLLLNQGQVVGIEIGALVEVSQAGSFTIGTTTNVTAAFVNPANPQPNGVFALHVTALDSDGWGIGTTSDGNFQSGVWRIFA